VSAPLGLIAGDGRLPLEIARAARGQGRRVIAAAFEGLSDPEIGSLVAELHWHALGEIDSLVRVFRAAGVRESVMAGKVSKTFLYRHRSALRPDARALEILADLRDRRDDSILSALARVLEEEGMRLLPQAELVPHLMAGPGPLGAVRVSPEQWSDLAFGWKIAKQLGKLDIGQCAVVRAGAVLALEAIEGSDAAIRRGGALGGPGACVVKVAKPDQDPRFDLPAVGPGTLEALVEAKAAVLAFEAHRTVVLDRDELVEGADAACIALLGIGPGGPQNPEDSARGAA
jgi:DUF1009 family protein